MERLTDKHYTGDGYYMKCSGRLRCEDNCGECDQLDEVIDHLGAYEDTGLEPEEIREVQAALAPIPFGRFRDIMEAERAGRLVVLSTPMIPLVQGEDSMNTDVYCPRCGESVSGGWPNAEPDSEWKLCQCPYCGQSIDDWKVITREEAERAMGGGDLDG